MTAPLPGKSRPRWIKRWLSSQCAPKPPARRQPIRLFLECLEDRLTPSGPGTQSFDPANTAQPTSVLQPTLISLFLDGAALELENLAEQFTTNIDEDPLPTQQNSAAAASAGFNYNAIVALSNVLFSMGHSVSASLTDIQQNLPYAGPFSLFVVEAGAQAAQQAVHL